MIISPAQRLQSVSEYYFSKKLKEIATMNAEGKNVLNLGIGNPDNPPSPATINTLVETSKQPKAHGYQSYVGIPALRAAFADWYKTYFCVQLNPLNEILPLMGSKEGIMHISLAFIDKGDGVLVPNPGYPTYSSVSNLVEANIIEYDLIDENGWLPDFEAIEKHDLSKVKIMWVNYPNMPTGARASMELFEKLIAFGRKHNILIVNDNPYSFIQNDEQLSILAVEGAKDVALELNSLSKSQNMPGWRMGMIAGRADYIQTILNVKSNMDSGMFLPMMEAAVVALQNPKSWYDEINVVYTRRRVKAIDIMKYIGCDLNEDQVGMFIWARIPDTYRSVEELSDFILYNANVFITPGFIFGSNGARYLRISLCTSELLLQEALDRIKKIL
jgi:aspartate/methionine/tyrosine aminotransferase